MDLTKAVEDKRQSIKKAKGKFPPKVWINVEISILVGSEKGWLEATAKSGRRKLGNTTVEYHTDPTAKCESAKEDE